jgi:hypothetical protein
MQRLLKHKLLIGVVAVLALAGAGGAYAATQTQTNPRQALLNDVAKRLNVSPSKLRSALQGALLDRLEAAVKAGRLTQAQANRMKQRIESGALPLVGGAGFGPGRFGPGRFGAAGPLNGPFAAAAKYLGLSPSQLLRDLNGKTLAQVAQAQGKSVSGLEQAIVTDEKARLDKLVAQGFLTQAQEQRRLSRLSSRVARFVEHGRISRVARPPRTGPAAPPMKQLFQAPAAPAGGPGVPPPPAA